MANILSWPLAILEENCEIAPADLAFGLGRLVRPELLRSYVSHLTCLHCARHPLPLLAMNPMGKDHITALLAAYLAIDADVTGPAQVGPAPADAKLTRE